ncbi:amidohydrolase family protein [Pseudonocardia sp. TMWB2A]|uniref:amidohydrolase family protein n=1 Tax=Pseudonocardia sp. TMWB2A TaxID=687430 RepID=UPI00307F66E1
MTEPGTLIRDVRVFDGRAVVAADSVRVAGGLITEVGEGLRPAPDEQVVEGAGATLLPGLIDAHTHVFPGSPEQALLFGVTTELDMFADPAVARDLRGAASYRDDMADLRSAGTGATAPGGHPSHLVDQGIYPPFPTLAPGGDADGFVAARVAEGSDHLKIVVDDGAVFGYPRPTLDRATVAALVTAAHRRGLLTVAHPGGLADVELLVEAGVDGLAHVPADRPVGPGLAARIAGRDMFVVPTLGVGDAACGCGAGPQLAVRPDLAPYLDRMSTIMLTVLDGNFPLGPGARTDPSASRASVTALLGCGVTILAGTDAGTLGVAHGASLHHELALLVEAGMTPVQALTAATAAPAGVFGLTDRGRVVAGTRADLLLVDGDPTVDITCTTAIVDVWRSGSRVRRRPRAAAAPDTGSTP